MPCAPNYTTQNFTINGDSASEGSSGTGSDDSDDGENLKDIFRDTLLYVTGECPYMASLFGFVPEAQFLKRENVVETARGVSFRVPLLPIHHHRSGSQRWLFESPAAHRKTLRE